MVEDELEEETTSFAPEDPVLGYIRSAPSGEERRREEKAVPHSELLSISNASQKEIQEKMDGDSEAGSESPIVRAGFLLPLFNAKLTTDNDTNDADKKKENDGVMLGQQSNRCPCVCKNECHCESECLCEPPPKTIFSMENLRAWWSNTMKKTRKSTLLPYTFCMIIFVGCFAIAVVLTLFIAIFCILPYKAWQFRKGLRNFTHMITNMF